MCGNGLNAGLYRMVIKCEIDSCRESGSDNTSVNVELKLEDEITKFKDIRMAAKIVSADIVHQSVSSIKV